MYTPTTYVLSESKTFKNRFIMVLTQLLIKYINCCIFQETPKSEDNTKVESHPASTKTGKMVVCRVILLDAATQDIEVDVSKIDRLFIIWILCVFKLVICFMYIYFKTNNQFLKDGNIKVGL